MNLKKMEMLSKDRGVLFKRSNSTKDLKSTLQTTNTILKFSLPPRPNFLPPTAAVSPGLYSRSLLPSSFIFLSLTWLTSTQSFVQPNPRGCSLNFWPPLLSNPLVFLRSSFCHITLEAAPGSFWTAPTPPFHFSASLSSLQPPVLLSIPPPQSQSLLSWLR